MVWALCLSRWSRLVAMEANAKWTEGSPLLSTIMDHHQSDHCQIMRITDSLMHRMTRAATLSTQRVSLFPTYLPRSSLSSSASCGHGVNIHLNIQLVQQYILCEERGNHGCGFASEPSAQPEHRSHHRSRTYHNTTSPFRHQERQRL